MHSCRDSFCRKALVEVVWDSEAQMDRQRVRHSSRIVTMLFVFFFPEM